MFEKEEINEKAGEHCNEVMCSVCEHKTCDDTHLATLKCREWRDRRAGFYCGAEYGYNKAKEWHFVKDGDLPKEENLECLCIIRPIKEEGEPFESKDFRGVLYFRNGRFYLDEDNSNDWLKETNSDFTELVIAWKEIVLPELKESE